MLLDSDLPTGIAPLKVLPADWASYLPSLSSSYHIPVLMLDQQQHARVADLYDIGAFGNVTGNVSALRTDYYESCVDGDSGYQVCLIINGEAVLEHTFTWAWGSGPALPANIATINTAMTAIGSGYQLIEADLSGYTTF